MTAQIDLFASANKPVNPQSAAGKILAYLQTGGRFTKVEGWTLFKCLNVGGRVSDLRNTGYKIEHDWVLRGGKKVAEYYLCS